MLISHPLDYFERIFIINLPSRTDRRCEMTVKQKAIDLSLSKVNPHFNTLLGTPELGFQRAQHTDIHALLSYNSTPLVRNGVACVRWVRNLLWRC